MLLIAAVVVAILAGPSIWTVLLVALAAVAEVGEFMLGLAYTRRRRRNRLIGRTGRMRADGRVDIAGELWDARGAAGPGERVTVVGLAGKGTVLVAPEAPEGES